MIGALRARLVASAAVALFVFLSFFLLHPNTLAKLPRFSSSSSSSSRTSQSSSSQSSTAGDDKPYGRGYKGHSDPNDINRVANDTLGFGKVFVVGLPERTDKRDAIALTSSLTGFDVEWVDGVRGEKIPDSAVPFGVDRAALMDANLGSWRGHMNAIRRYVCHTNTYAYKLERTSLSQEALANKVGLPRCHHTGSWKKTSTPP